MDTAAVIFWLQRILSLFCGCETPGGTFARMNYTGFRFSSSEGGGLGEEGEWHKGGIAGRCKEAGTRTYLATDIFSSCTVHSILLHPL